LQTPSPAETRLFLLNTRNACASSSHLVVTACLLCLHQLTASLVRIVCRAAAICVIFYFSVSTLPCFEWESHLSVWNQSNRFLFRCFISFFFGRCMCSIVCTVQYSISCSMCVRLLLHLS
jgi:hypothetical protein